MQKKKKKEAKQKLNGPLTAPRQVIIFLDVELDLFQMTLWRPFWWTKPVLGELNSVLCKQFHLFAGINIATVYVTENHPYFWMKFTFSVAVLISRAL